MTRQRRRVTFDQQQQQHTEVKLPATTAAAAAAAAVAAAAAAAQPPPRTAEEARRHQLVKNARAWDNPLWWILLALLRLLLAVVQTGYIHPDEFHQALQVRARDVLSIEGQKTWEFTCDTPIRSVAFTCLVSLPYSLLHYLHPYASYYLGWTLLVPSTLLVAPRIFMTLLSFIADFCVYRIASVCYIRPWQCMEVFASSYVMLVYATRTFSNTIELILMCVVLWRVSLSMVESSKIIRKETILGDLYQSAEEMKEKVQLVRMRSKLPAYNYVDSIVLSVVITYGAFVRPTFIVYTFVPMTYWLQRGIVTKELDFKYFNRRCLSLFPGIFIVFVCIVLADSFYYESLTALELLEGNVTAISFTVTPINFYLYNRNPKNLAKHGQHPRYLHMLVNLPLLHGVLAVVALYYTSMYLSSIFSKKSMTKKPKVYSLASMLLFSFLVPVAVLSCFSHQEARFLLPTLPCIVLLHSDKVSLHNINKLKFSKHFLFIMWHTWNIFCVVFFGFLHQGGVTKAVIGVHDYILSRPQSSSFHVIFTHMYTPPTFLLMRQIDVISSTKEGRKFKLPRSVYSQHLAGSTSIKQLNSIMNAKLLALNATYSKVLEASPNNKHKAAEVLLCLPGSTASMLLIDNEHQLEFLLLARYPLHVTLEHLPDFNLKSLDINETCGEGCAAKKKLLQFSMKLYRVGLPHTDMMEQQQQERKYEEEKLEEEKNEESPEEEEEETMEIDSDRGEEEAEHREEQQELVEEEEDDDFEFLDSAFD